MQSAMRRVVTVAFTVLLGLGAFAGSAEAIPFDKVEGWWNALNCERMNTAVNAFDPKINAMGMNSGYCAMYAGLGKMQKMVVDMAAKEIGGDFATIQYWWEALDCRKMTIATGYPAPTYCGHFRNAPKATPLNVMTVAQEDAVAIVGYALATGNLRTAAQVRMTGIWMAFPAMPVPALPLVGAGLLGLLLVGRGAWLRRRS